METPPPESKPRSRKRWFLLLLVPPLTVFVLSVSSCSAPELGILTGRLLPLPETPNCVSSLAKREEQRVAPLPLRTDISTAHAGLTEIVSNMPRAEVFESKPNYLRFVFTSLICRFKDDIEFHFVAAENVIHVRSASRVGHSDFGVNRERVETIRASYDTWVENATKPK